MPKEMLEAIQEAHLMLKQRLHVPQFERLDDDDDAEAWTGAPFLSPNKCKKRKKIKCLLMSARMHPSPQSKTMTTFSVFSPIPTTSPRVWDIRLQRNSNFCLAGSEPAHPALQPPLPSCGVSACVYI